MNDSIINIRHCLHAHPGLSGEEHYAHDLVVDFLGTCSPTKVWEHVGGYGVVAVWGEEKSKATLAFRADIDALPINESTSIPYASEIPLVAHKCGHDGHTAILLRFAQMVGRAFEDLKYNIILVFQPEEETGFGSQKILNSGILQQYNIKGIFGLHNLPGYPEGNVVLNYHTFAAASTGMIVSFYGRQTHASTPEKGINPGLAIAEAIQKMSALNDLDNISFNRFRQSTLIGVRVGDEAFGTSAGAGQVLFTLRTFSNQRMEQMLEEVSDMMGDIAKRHGLTFTIEYREPFFATENNSLIVEQLGLLLDDYKQIVEVTPFRWSEDFANYLMSFPGAMFGIGAGVKHAELHHPDYDFPDEIIETAASVFWKIALNFEIS